jgi:hypothetical protein
VPAVGVGELLEDEVTEIVDVEHVAHLLARAAVSDVAERAADVMGQEPVREHALVHLAHLPRSGKHATTIHHGPDAETVGVLANEQLGREFRRSVQRSRSLERERLADPRRRRAGYGLLVGQREPRRLLAQHELLLGRDRIDAAGGDEHHLGAVAARQLEAVVGADQVRLHDIVGARSHPGQHGRLGRALDDRLDRLEREQVLARAHVAVHEPDAGLAQARQVELRAPPLERVERDDVDPRAARGEREAQTGADEAGPAGDEYAFWQRGQNGPG